jgi:hypothetical protein
MKELKPSWTAKQMAAGQQFGDTWRGFFARAGKAPAPPVPGLSLQADLAAVRAQHDATLMRYPNVVGVSEGTRMRAGKPTGEPVITVLVSHKVPPKALQRNAALPSEIGGVPIDVVEVGPIEALPAPAGAKAGPRRAARKSIAARKK